ncbi:MAG: immunoglobulin domain-containing protein [Phycisphaerales bacterium JB060]
MHAEIRLGTAVAILGLAGATLAQEITAIEPIDGYDTLTRLRLSGDGTTAAGTARDADGLERSFKWTSAGGVVELEHLSSGAGQSSRVAGLSTDGRIVVGHSGGSVSGTSGVRWIEGVVPEPMRIPGAGGGMDVLRVRDAIRAFGDGAGAVGYGYGFGIENTAFRWRADAGVNYLGTLAGGWSAAYGVSADGGVVVGLSSGSTTSRGRAFIWTEADGMEDVGTLPGDSYALARNISGDGSMAFGESWDSAASYDAGQTNPCVWVDGAGVQPATMLDGAVRAIFGESTFDASLIVGYCVFPDASRIATVWTDPTTPIPAEDYLADAGVDLTGWTLETVHAVSYGGTILAGKGTLDGQDRFWVANLSGAFPTPPSITVQPIASQIADAGSTVELSVVVDIGTSEPTFQWRRNGQPLVGGAPYSGVDTPELVINGATAGETDLYDVVVTNDAGSVTSDPALVAIRQPCIADFDGDGELTIFDFLAFQNAFDAGCP